MSVEMSSMVWKRYPNGGGELLLALALADHAHDDGQHIFPGVASLMAKTRQSERTVQNQLRAMIDSGWLIPTNKATGGAGNKREFRINPLWITGADFDELKKGADSAPFEKGATGDKKGAIGDIKRVQSTTPTNNHTLTVKESSGGAKPAASRSGQGKRLDADWKLPKAWGEWALEKYPHWTADYVREVATLFANHWLAKSGRDATKVRWDLTWQSWCINEEKLRPFKNPAMAAQQVGGEWWKSSIAIEAKAKEFGIHRGAEELFPHFRDRVYIAAGDGPWMQLIEQGPVRSHSAPATPLGAELKGNLKSLLKKAATGPDSSAGAV